MKTKTHKFIVTIFNIYNEKTNELYVSLCDKELYHKNNVFWQFRDVVCKIRSYFGGSWIASQIMCGNKMMLKDSIFNSCLIEKL